MVIDDQLNILPVSSHTINIKPVPPKAMVSVLRGCIQDYSDIATEMLN